MKLLTLNAHSLIGQDWERRLRLLADFLAKERPTLSALQEVSQPMAAAQDRIPIRSDNFMALLAKALWQRGVDANWVWLPVKRGYERYDEGLAMLCLCGRIAETDALPLTRSQDYASWKTRAALGVRMEGCEDWFYTVHMGWWEDADEPFAHQWKRLSEHLREKRRSGRVWLMGDFNSPAGVRGQGYDLIASGDWRDAWLSADARIGEATVPAELDGWRERSISRDRRIDHIWCSALPRVRRASVVLDGAHSPQVSDHYGVLAEIES